MRIHRTTMKNHFPFESPMMLARFVSTVFLALVLIDSLRADIISGLRQTDIQMVSEFQSALLQSALEEARNVLLTGNVARSREIIMKARETEKDLPLTDLLVASWLLEANQSVPAFQLMEQTAATHPPRRDIHILYARVSLIQGRVFDASVHLEAAKTAANDPDWSASFNNQLDIAMLEIQATIADRRGNWKESDRLFTELKNVRPKSTAAINGLVRAAFFREEVETAEKYLRELETIQGPQGTLTELALASLFEANRNPTKVEEWFKKGLERENNEPIRREYAKWLIRNNRAEEAKEMATNTKPSESQTSEFVFIIALSEQMLGNFEASEPILARLDKVKPDTFQVMNHLVWAMLASQDAETRKTALQLANRTVSKFPLSMEAVATLGWAFHKNGDSQMGEEVFDRPTTSKNLSRDAAYFLAQIKEAVGKKEEAERILAGVQKAEGEFFHAKMLSEVSVETPPSDAK